jgi:hypothetical protein
MNDQTDLRSYLAGLAQHLIAKIKAEKAYDQRLRHALDKQWTPIGELGSRLADDMTRAAATDKIGWYRIPKPGDAFNAALREAMQTANKDLFRGLCSDDPDIQKVASEKLSERIVKMFEQHNVAVTRRRRKPESEATSANVVDISQRSKRR